jgi:hypothetical protein
LSASARASSPIIFGQAVENNSVPGDHSSPGLDHLRADLNGGQNNDTAAHRRLHKIALVEICGTERALVKRHGQAITLPADLDS